MKYNVLRAICILLLSMFFVEQGIAARIRNGKEEGAKMPEIKKMSINELYAQPLAKARPTAGFRMADNRYGSGNLFAESRVFKAGFVPIGFNAIFTRVGTNWKSRLKDALLGLLLVLMISGCVIFYLNRSRNNKLIKALCNELHNKKQCLEIANEEHDWLIKEIHHRVKNNLQIVMSLLNTQGVYETSIPARQAIRNSQHRMYAISLVHQKLYQAHSLSEVDMVVYTQELVQYLTDAFEVSDKVIFELNMIPLSLDVSLAVSFGLIVNEAISNTLKYAFPLGAGGTVTINLNTPDAVQYNLSIADNGVGLGINDKKDKTDSFGKTLMAGLSRQLGGQYNIINNNGVKVLVTFDKKPGVVYNLN